MGSAKDEIRKRNQCRCDAYNRAIQRRHKNFRMRIKSFGRVEGVGYRFPEGFAPDVCAGIDGIAG